MQLFKPDKLAKRIPIIRTSDEMWDYSMSLLPPREFADLVPRQRSKEESLNDVITCIQHYIEIRNLIDLCAPDYDKSSEVQLITEILCRLAKRYYDIYLQLNRRHYDIYIQPERKLTHSRAEVSPINKAIVYSYCKGVHYEKLGITPDALIAFRKMTLDKILKKTEYPAQADRYFDPDHNIRCGGLNELVFTNSEGWIDGVIVGSLTSGGVTDFKIQMFRDGHITQILSFDRNNGYKRFSFYQTGDGHNILAPTTCPTKPADVPLPPLEDHTPSDIKAQELHLELLDGDGPTDAYLNESCIELAVKREGGISPATVAGILLGGLLVKAASAGRRKKDIKHEEVFEKEA